MAPLYDFSCKTHGDFESTMTLSDYDKSRDKEGYARSKCPKCKKLSRRVITKAFPVSASWKV